MADNLKPWSWYVALLTLSLMTGVVLAQDPVRYFNAVYPLPGLPLQARCGAVNPFPCIGTCISAAVCASKRENLISQGCADQELRTATALAKTVASARVLEPLARRLRLYPRHVYDLRRLHHHRPAPLPLIANYQEHQEQSKSNSSSRSSGRCSGSRSSSRRRSSNSTRGSSHTGTTTPAAQLTPSCW